MKLKEIILLEKVFEVCLDEGDTDGLRNRKFRLPLNAPLRSKILLSTVTITYGFIELLLSLFF